MTDLFGPVADAERNDGAGPREDELGIEPLGGGSFHPLHIGVHAGFEPCAERRRILARNAREPYVVEAESLQALAEFLLTWIALGRASVLLTPSNVN